MSGFRGRSGRNFRAKLKIEPRGDEPGKWKVEFDEEWASQPPKQAEEAAVQASESGDAAGAVAETAEQPAAATG